MTLNLKPDRHVVTAGNYSFAAAGQPLFVHTGKRIHYNVMPGQGVVYTQEADGTTLTHSSATINSTNAHRLFIGVGVDLNGDGITEAIRHIGIEHISACRIDQVAASSPRCGSPQVIDFYFDCTKCNETYSLEIEVDDNESRAFSPWNKSAAQFTGSIVTECVSCSDCAPEHNCKEVACKLASRMNNELDLKIGNRLYPDFKAQGRPRPYFATRLHDNTFIYCLSPQTENGSCENCTYIPAVTGAVINGVPYTFQGTTNPIDNTQSLVGQVKSITDQLNDAFKTEYGEHAHMGSAYYTGSYQGCCPIQLHVNTCYDGFQLLGAAGAQISVSQTYNPFTTHGTETADPNCLDCGETPATLNYTCGIRVIAEKLEPSCGCIIDKPLAFYGRKIKVNPYGDDWRGKSWMVKEIQGMELPSGFGREIQFYEYQQIPQGKGHVSNRSNTVQGWGATVGKTDRFNNVTARCDADYCSYYLHFIMDRRKLSNERGDLDIHSWIHIPNTDTDTLDDWEAIQNAVITASPGCVPISNVLCDRSLGACPPVASPTPSPSSTPGASSTPTATVTPTATPSVTPTVTPTVTPSPSA